MQTLHKYVHSMNIAILNSHNQTDTMSFFDRVNHVDEPTVCQGDKPQWSPPSS